VLAFSQPFGWCGLQGVTVGGAAVENGLLGKGVKKSRTTYRWRGEARQSTAAKQLRTNGGDEQQKEICHTVSHCFVVTLRA